MTGAGGLVWFGGGKLAADLSLPKLRQRWYAPSADPRRSGPLEGAEHLTSAERNAMPGHGRP